MPRLWTAKRTFALLGLSIIGMLQALAALQVASAGTRLLTHPQVRDLANLAVLVAGLSVLVVMQVFISRQSERFALSYVRQLRLAFMSHVMRRPADTKPTAFGLVMSRVVNDFSAVKIWLSAGLAGSFVALSVSGTILVYFAILIPDVFVALGVALGLWMLCALFCVLPIYRVIAHCRRARGHIAGKAGALLNGQMTLFAHGQHDKIQRRLERYSDDLHAALIRRATWGGTLSLAGEFVFPLTAIGLAFGLYTAAPVTIAADQLGVLLIALGLLVAQTRILARALDLYLGHRVAMWRLGRIFAKPAVAVSRDRKRLRRKGKGRDLVVENLVVQGIDRAVSFTVPAGKTVCLSQIPPLLVSGVFRQIAGLTVESRGRISLDGQDIDATNRRDWLRSICWLSPELPLVPGTLRRNAMLGAASAVSRTERMRLCHEFGLGPDRLNLRLREDTRIDGRTAFAIRALRTVMRRPAVVLVDDPEYIRHDDLRAAFLAELRRRNTTVILADPAYDTTPRPVEQEPEQLDTLPKIRGIA